MRIEARDILAGYGQRPVLHGVTVELAAGEFLALIGPNGSGKSTLLRVMSRSLPRRGGRLAYDGVPSEQVSSRELALRVAFVPQQEPAVFDFSVRETVLMGRHPHLRGLEGERPDDFAAANRAMAATNVLHLADRPITALSGGEHRRVLVARALAQETPTIVLDEPTAHLDITHQTDLLAALRRLAHREGVAVLAALHDLNAAAEYCDRVALLAGGRLAACGTPREVLTPQAIEHAYEVPVQVARSPATGRPLVLPVAPPDADAEQDSPRVHVVCGGGAGSETLCGLRRLGYTVTAGVVNRMDTDEEAATALGIEHVCEAPFSPIGDEARSACAALIRRASAVVVTPAPFGRGNIANLELAADALARGVPVFLMQSEEIAGRDFTAGAASGIWERMLAAGATPVTSIADVDEVLRASRPPQAVPAPSNVQGAGS